MAGTQVTADVIKDGSITAAKLAPGAGGTSWQSTPKTSDFTAVSGEGYFVDTTSSAVTVTLPSSPSVGDSISIVDQGGAAGSNAIVLASANKIQNSTDNKELVISNISINVVYSGAAKGWLVYSAANESASVLTDPAIELRALLIGGGGGGGYGVYAFQGANGQGGGGGAGEFLDKPNIEIETGLDYTVTVGAGSAQNTNGNNTSIVADSSASNTFDYEVFGGGHGGYHGDNTGDTGGSSGGAGITRYPVSSAVNSVAETKNEGNLGSRANQGGNSFLASSYNVCAGGGGGAGADGNNGSVNYPNGGNGGDGFQSDITGTNTYYAGGGGGGSSSSSYAVGTGGAGGGGGPDSAGSANTGSGGSGNHWNAGGYAGGSGIIILRYPGDLTLTETTSPSVLTFTTATDGVEKVTTITAGTNGTIQFN